MESETDFHPGDMLLQEVIKPLGITTKRLAERLGVSENSLSAVIEGRKPIDADLAQKLEGCGISTARFWLALQIEANPKRRDV